MSRNIASSIKARLLAVAKSRGEEFELCLVRYACERFLFRLGASPLRDQCTVKGAGLLVLWLEDPYRATRDVDLLMSGTSDEKSIRETVDTICRIPCPEDGLTFDHADLVVMPIREEMAFQGQRAVLWAYLDRTRIRMPWLAASSDVALVGRM